MKHGRPMIASKVLWCMLFALLWPMAATAQPSSPTLVLVHGTVIDVSHRGTTGNDIDNAVVVVRDGHILEVGSWGEIDLPPDAQLIDCTGQYLVPGLIDGFAVLNHQAYANAFLAMGVTSILGVESTRRGPLDLDSDPSPRIYRLGEAGYEAAPLDELLAQVDREHERGMDVVLLMYRITPEQMKPLVERVHELGMACIGELARTRYTDAAKMGVDVFVHSSRYSLDLAPDDLRQGILAIPFSNDLQSAKWRYYRALGDYAQQHERVATYGRKLASSSVFLMPTFSMGYLDRPGHKNPWKEPVAKILDPRDINWPADPTTGEVDYTPDERKAYARLIAAEMALDTQYAREGCPYLAGSGTDVWGTMPGISLHHELEALAEIGLAPRQALAAATGNFRQAYGWKDIGAIEAGARADLLVLKADPRESVSALREIGEVILAGQRLDRTALLQPITLDDGQLLRREPMELPQEVLNENGTPKPEYSHLKDVRIDTITYMSDGLRVEGHLLRPKAPGPYPCVIYNRGGNREFGANSPLRAAYRLARIASWGYMVAASQYRGNDGGEGQEEFGGAEVDDILNLLPLLASLPEECDTTRVGMVGSSRGGMMSYLTLARTDRLKATVIMGGMSDSFAEIAARPEMESVYAELVPDYAAHRDQALLERSAVRWVDSLCKTTPLLLMHGSADWRVPATQALDMADSLLAKQHPFRLILFEGGDHGLSEYRAEVYSQMQMWLDRYVRDGQHWPSLEKHGP